MKKNQRGFTLLELILSVAITAMLVALASQIYQTVNRVGNRSLSLNQDWAAMQFMRTQYDAVDIGLNAYFQSVKADETTFSFVSKNSAQFGKSKQPVLATYFYNGASRKLNYIETALPAWWDQERRDFYAAQIDSWRMEKNKSTYDNTLLNDLDDVRFEYWDTVNKKWTTLWNQKKILPPLVKMKFTKLGQNQELVMAPGVLSLSSAYGY